MSEHAPSRGGEPGCARALTSQGVGAWASSVYHPMRMRKARNTRWKQRLMPSAMMAGRKKKTRDSAAHVTLRLSPISSSEPPAAAAGQAGRRAGGWQAG